MTPLYIHVYPQKTALVKQWSGWISLADADGPGFVAGLKTAEDRYGDRVCSGTFRFCTRLSVEGCLKFIQDMDQKSWRPNTTKEWVNTECRRQFLEWHLLHEDNGHVHPDRRMQPFCF